MGRQRGGNKLEPYHVRYKLLRDIAYGDKSQSQLAEKYGVVQSAISTFGKRHRAEIEELREHAADRYAGIAIADKQFRIGLYNDLIKRMTEAGVDEKAIAVAVRAMRNVAEEMGELPTRVQLAGEVQVKTNYTINGVDASDLT